MVKTSPPAALVYPFEAAPDQLERQLGEFIEATIGSLSSFYLELPRGDSYVDLHRFNAAYTTLQTATSGFTKLNRDLIYQAVRENLLVLVVLRGIVGLSPPELADLATTADVNIDQGFARGIDQRGRKGQKLAAGARPTTTAGIRAMIDAACRALEEPPSTHAPGTIHRLDKIDTVEGLKSVQRAARAGVPYPALLHERILGRPFATHRDAVSELVGNIVEDAIVEQLHIAHVPFHKTGVAEKVPGFDQAPDFLCPDATAPTVVIEAKLTQDDGTARDKVTRVQHLDSLSKAGKHFQVVACIDGRGFKIRREDMRKLLLATKGKVFTMGTIDRLVEHTELKRLARP